MEASKERAGNIMTVDVIHMNPADSLEDAYECMVEYNFRHIPIVEGDCKLVGIISDRDILRHMSPK